MSRASAYRLRERDGAESFARAWDRVMTPPGSGRLLVPTPDWRKVTDQEVARLARVGFVQPVLYRRTLVSIRHKPDNSALLRFLRRRGGSGVRALPYGFGQ